MQEQVITSSSEPRIHSLKDRRKSRPADPEPSATEPSVVELPVPTRSQLLREYTEACANMRHYGNARLTRLVMFLALNGGLLSLLFTHHATVARDLIMATKFAAVLVTALFAVVDYNLVVHFRWFNRRARQVEAVIGLKQYTVRQTNRDQWPHNTFNETHATWLMYVTVGMFWIYCLLVH